jgi:elongation factor P
MGSTADFRPGLIVKFNGENCMIIDYEHRKPGKGGAIFQVKLKNLKTGRILENRYRSGESVEVVRVDKKAFQYLYKDGSHLYFMNMENYDQIPIDETIVGDAEKFLKENQDVQISFEGDEVLGIELPPIVNLKVTHTEPGERGNTATNALKPATVETGAQIMVPLFINTDDMIRVDTTAGNYVERVK